jgi:N-acetylneuraminate 9-O-acetyltransferase
VTVVRYGRFSSQPPPPQVLFLLYHYFEAREAYNLVRVLIASYVWLTGYGNFQYYLRSGDYTIGRFAQMLWRLNFLVAACCAVLRNHYMLYYICPMHTAFTVLVYATLGIGSRLNASRWGLAAKMATAVGVVAVVWEVRPVFYTLFAPLRFLFGYVDPRRPTADNLHGALLNSVSARCAVTRP